MKYLGGDKMKRFLLPLIVILFTIFLVSCGKEYKSPTVGINVSILQPDGSKLSTQNSAGRHMKTLIGNERIVYIVLNISGVGITVPIFWNWDSKGNDNPPLTVNLTVPTGNNRLVQALVVTEGSGDNGKKTMTFYYGENSVNISGDASININASKSGYTDKSLDFMGRYLYSAPTVGPTGTMIDGPSGPVSVYMKPQNPSSPRMKIQKSIIVNGWFKFFAVSGVNFDYVVDSYQGRPEEIIFQGLNADSLLLNTSDQVMKISVPVYYYVSPNFTNLGGKAGIFHFGFWGPGSVNKKVCYDPADNGKEVFKYTSGVTTISKSGLFLDSAGTTYLRWYDGITSAADTNHLWRIGGGLPTTSGICASGQEMTDILIFHPLRIKNGLESAVGILPPFTIPPTSSLLGLDVNEGSTFSRFITFDFASAGSSTGNLKLRWQYLSGVASMIAGVNLYYKIDNTNQGSGQDSDFCYRAPSLGYSTESISGSSSEHITQFSVNSNQINGQLKLLLCPYVNIGGSIIYIGEPLDPHLSYNTMSACGNFNRFGEYNTINYSFYQCWNSNAGSYWSNNTRLDPINGTPGPGSGQVVIIKTSRGYFAVLQLLGLTNFNYTVYSSTGALFSTSTQGTYNTEIDFDGDKLVDAKIPNTPTAGSYDITGLNSSTSVEVCVDSIWQPTAVAFSNINQRFADCYNYRAVVNTNAQPTPTSIAIDANQVFLVRVAPTPGAPSYTRTYYRAKTTTCSGNSCFVSIDVVGGGAGGPSPSATIAANLNAGQGIDLDNMTIDTTPTPGTNRIQYVAPGSTPTPTFNIYPNVGAWRIR